MSSHANNEHEYHPPGLQHQFEDMDQQVDSVSIGMWAFLAQEILFFGGLFTVYLVFRSKFPMAFAAGSNHLDAFLGGTNTLVLIVSSLTMALTVFYAQRGDRLKQVVLIILTMIFGVCFLGIKAVEYSDKYNHGLIPADGWNMSTGRTRDGGVPAVMEKEHKPEAEAKPAGEHGEAEHVYNNPTGEFQWKDVSLVKEALDLEKETGKPVLTKSEKLAYFSNGEVDPEKFQGRVKIFFWIYFMMTGLHALHMIIGLGLMTWLLYKAWKDTFSEEYYAPVEIMGLYWHFVDIVWIFLFPLLYLLGRHFIH